MMADHNKLMLLWCKYAGEVCLWSAVSETQRKLSDIISGSLDLSACCHIVIYARQFKVELAQAASTTAECM